ncbi:hypothetical protein AVEN_39773-1 [Araneus ventricosus]|uniref:Tc1-like transposase DDE domain-containing protein n=1 Tax=Araneus ventricosus TaxID=182803 RepID=A0A4Y2GFU6_ARAVE|nr:hypothetical protein AVEN_39773-1 [Araneus ventricosus]
MFSWRALGPLISVEGTLNSCAYLSIVASQVHPYMATGYPANNGVFQLVNVTCHVSKIVSAWLEEKDEELQLLPWPPNSPDFNPCENLWEHLDRHIRQKDPPLGIFTSYVMLCCSHGHRCLSPPSKHTLSPRPAA